MSTEIANFGLSSVDCRSPLNCTCFTYLCYVVLLYNVYQTYLYDTTQMTSLVSGWRALIIASVLPSTAVFFHGTYRGTKSVVPRNTNADIPWKIFP